MKLLLKEESDWAFKRPVSIQQYGAAIKWKEEREQAGAQLIFLLGAQVDKLATLFTAFFLLPFVS